MLTLFPEVIEPFLNSSLIGKAIDNGAVEVQLIQIRDFAEPPHFRVDDKPYGGGVGMVLRADILYLAWRSAVRADSPSQTILLSPQGARFDQALAKDMSEALALGTQYVFVCGHYEGIDERFIDACVDQEISIGDYVLTGGEIPAAALIDAVVRLLPGTVQKSESVRADSLEDGLLKYPQYTRPPDFQGQGVPEVLLSGNHGEIEKWRNLKREEVTARKRPDLRKPRGQS